LHRERDGYEWEKGEVPDNDRLLEQGHTNQDGLQTWEGWEGVQGLRDHVDTEEVIGPLVRESLLASTLAVPARRDSRLRQVSAGGHFDFFDLWGALWALRQRCMATYARHGRQRSDFPSNSAADIRAAGINARFRTRSVPGHASASRKARSAKYSVVQGPMPGCSSKASFTPRAIWPTSQNGIWPLAITRATF